MTKKSWECEAEGCGLKCRHLYLLIRHVQKKVDIELKDLKDMSEIGLESRVVTDHYDKYNTNYSFVR